MNSKKELFLIRLISALAALDNAYPPSAGDGAGKPSDGYDS